MTEGYVLSEAHKTSAALRVPLFKPDTPRSERVNQLEDYMLLSAYWLGECHSERLESYQELGRLEEQWGEVTTWDLGSRVTQAQVEEAKRNVDPECWTSMKRARWRVDRLSEEIERLDRDATKVSRAYTLITGT